MNFTLLSNRYAICKFAEGLPLPEWVYSSGFYSITRTKDELSVVAVQTDSVSEDIICSRDWRIFKVAGPMDLSLVGIISEISGTLRNKDIPVFVISTFDTDYILVKQKDLDCAISALHEKGHNLAAEERDMEL
jgi:hypothetical protein